MNTLELNTLKQIHQKTLQEQREQRRIDEIMLELKQRLKEYDRISDKQDN